MIAATADAKLTRDLLTLARFIRVYCDGRHRDRPKAAVEVKFCDLKRLLGRPPELCPQCGKLLAHALVKRLHCPMDPKPECKHCPQHCYHPDYRRQIREVMRYSGWRLIARGRLDLLLHMLS